MSTTLGSKRSIGIKFDRNIDLLLRGDGTELDSYLAEIVSKVSINGTNSSAHCYVVKLDGNNQPRVNDLAQAVALRMIDYCIPRSEIIRARELDNKLNTTVEFSKLKLKARKLFTNIEATGEGGEILLYMLTQSFLKIPQLLCKMPLKTNSQVHYHGVDGIHIKYDESEQKLALYWGESKLHSTIEEALSKCFKSISPFLIDTGGSSGAQFRDLQLIKDNLDLCNPELEKALLRYLDPDDPNFNQLQYRGVCLIGFNDGAYPSQPNAKTLPEVMSEISTKISNWKIKTSNRLLNRAPLDKFFMEIFLLPFPSVDEFRKAFLEEIKYV